MKLFQCHVCDQALFFENETCEKCGHRLGYEPGAGRLLALDPAGEGWSAPDGPGGDWRFCDNAAHGVCNWLLPADVPERLCLSCRQNQTIPDLSEPAHLPLWRRVEDAKHRLTYSLLALHLPLGGLAFDILADTAGGPVMTGHADGLITLNLAEADDGEREKRRANMGETYRTLLGHVRHEAGHFFWDRLVRDGDRLQDFRALFGDEREDYAQALQRHYAQGARADWLAHHVSAYASAHPWEDFAETFAHYLHIVDTLETARAFGMKIRPRIAAAEAISAEIDFDPHHMADVQKLIEAWLPICFAVNSLNRSMGQPDLYPFILSPRGIEKLGFVARLVRREAEPMD